ncbi:FMN-linked oxidoreductase [Lophiostoma macrostomum CBS 122681]|uniref:FMN-linked oxidoreductase n=1 Tax=Lophiostoma macrostomum CBS 122681 TaxID=1314788 RepID=A0A6A6T2X1_9PLEO|nr:FMN-linked oxidoreductase [Lophiostoma macrostomum CBS 122681]
MDQVAKLQPTDHASSPTVDPVAKVKPIDHASSPLLSPLRLDYAQHTAQNRFMKASMTERLASWDPRELQRRGIPSVELINLYTRWGQGRYGMILTGNIMVDPVNLEAPGNMIVPLDPPDLPARIEAWSKLAHGAKRHGSLIVGQVSHPGRQVDSRLQSDPVSASDVHLDKEVFGMTFAKPHAATKDEISKIVASFTNAACFLHSAGFDGIQLHAAHGYLLAQFLAQSTNRRGDEYGGSLRNRSRIIADIASAIRKRIPQATGFLLGIKLNSVEFQEGGFSAEDCTDLCTILERDLNFDFIELSGGTYESLAFEHKRESTKKREAFFLEFADQIVPRLSHTKVYVTGGFKTISGIEQALDTVDGVGVARATCARPFLPRDIAQGKVRDSLWESRNEYDYGMSEVVAGTQMLQIARDQLPMDLSIESHLKAFERSMNQWEEKLTQDKDMKITGYVDVEGINLQTMDVAASL